MKTALVTTVPLDLDTLGLDPEQIIARNAAIAETSNITVVDSPFGRECAIDAVRSLKAVEKSAEDSRKEVKAPVIAYGKQIEELAKSYKLPVQQEVTRLTKLLNDHQRVIDQQAAEQRRVEEVERQRLAAEERKRQEELDRQRREAASVEALAQVEEAAAIADATAAFEKASLIKVEEKPVSQGVAVRRGYKHQLTDVQALFEARPDLCRIEPDNAAIRAALKDGLRECAGLNIYPDTQVSVRK